MEELEIDYHDVYSIGENGVVLKNGAQTVCPNANRVPVPGNMGGFNIVTFPCATSCPKCNLASRKVGNDVFNFVEISCNGTVCQFEIEVEIPQVKQPESKLVSI
jgi:hypothetical protein